MSEKFTAEELLLAERVLARAEAQSNPAEERRRLGLRHDETSDALIKWQVENSYYNCLDRTINQLKDVARAIRDKSSS
ncbi:hypothetical protein ACIPL1_24680 [Pseudomonas sp. NPDC090202]|uniref:hypothetical protein n=1 Tax=Pseudomonas sp. NPDC090202 TaxID=3364476 RepID=UPI0038007CC1